LLLFCDYLELLFWGVGLGVLFGVFLRLLKVMILFGGIGVEGSLSWVLLVLKVLGDVLVLVVVVFVYGEVMVVWLFLVGSGLVVWVLF